jgi:hypothetical protein
VQILHKQTGRAQKHLEKEYARECLGKHGKLLEEGEILSANHQGYSSPARSANSSKRRERARDIIVMTSPKIEGALNG